MPETDSIEALLEEDRQASDEIRRLKEVERLQVISRPQLSTENLEAARDYWEQRKREIAGKMRLMR